MYCPDLFNYHRRKSSKVNIGNTPMGENYPIRLQSMTNTSTLDTEASVEQCMRIIKAGGEYVRLTAQGEREASNLKHIKQLLEEKGCSTPLVADIHFNPKAAETAALYVEKVRINPGNFVDSVKKFEKKDYSEAAYQQEIEKIKQRFVPFLNTCKENNTAIRIGVNHGSLSDRIINRYGDTPRGMVESCMEFLRICIDQHFSNVVISIKASSTLIMVQTVRLLVETMNSEGMSFPLHLGVTEAGEGEDGRIKSAVGIGALLNDGIGDTIRVSLSEDPEAEIPVAEKMKNFIANSEKEITCKPFAGFDPFVYNRRKTNAVGNIGGENVPVVIADRSKKEEVQYDPDLKPDFIFCGDNFDVETAGIARIVNASWWVNEKDTYPYIDISHKSEIASCTADFCFVGTKLSDLNEETIDFIRKYDNIILVAEADVENGFFEQRAFFHTLLNHNCKAPVVIRRIYNGNAFEDYQIKASMDCGGLFLDGFGDGIWLQNREIPVKNNISLMFGILQSASVRISKTEYISCPSCGRTLFDIQSTIAKVKAATSHLKGLKIAIMGCIVNGPGEMADADYGYIGSGKGKIDLYKKKVCVEKNIPETEAVDRLLDLVKKSKRN